MPINRCYRGAFIVVALTMVVGCSDGSTSGDTGTVNAASSTPSAKPTPTASPTKAPPKQVPLPVPTGPVGTPSVAVSTAPLVKVGTVAHILDEVLVRIGAVRDVTAKTTQPGEISGPAAAVSVTVRNNSRSAFSLGGMTVTASYGSGLPGDQITSSLSKPLTGSLAAGKTATGVYVFSVPRRYANTLNVEIVSDQSAIIVQFAR